MSNEYRLGYIPTFDNKKNIRSKWKFISRMIKNTIQTLPEQVDNSYGDIYNQENLGSCVCNSISYGISARKSFIHNNDNKYNSPRPSRLFLYTNYRIMNNIPLSTDSGADHNGVFSAIDKYKYVREPSWSYVKEHYFSPIPKTIYDFAKKLNYPKIKRTILVNNGSSLSSVNQLKFPLSKGKCIVFAFAVYDSFWTINSENNWIMPLPNIQNEKLQGYHSVLLVGFDNSTKLFKIINSWGYEWGDKGCFYIRYEDILNSSIFFDFYSIDQA